MLGYSRYGRVFRLVFFVWIAGALLFGPGSARSQTRIWLLEKETQSDSISMRVNSFRDIQVWHDVRTIQAQGSSFYIDFDPDVFNIEDLGTDPRIVEPFDYTTSLFGDNAVENSIQTNKLNGSVIMNNQFKTGSGKLARFRIISKKITQKSEIVIVYDRGQHRDTRYHILGNGSQAYDQRGKLVVTVFGLELSELPDIVLTPGAQDRSIVLYDYVKNKQGSVNQLIYQSTGGNGNVTATIDAQTSRVTLTASPGFLGSETIIFSVTEGGFTAQDSIVVNVTSPPVITNLPATLQFNEDEEYRSPLYSEIVEDTDHGPNQITFSGTTLSGPLTLEFRNSEKRFYIRAAQNYNGNGRIRLIATDPLGAKDTLDVNVQVLPVNDPPSITPIGDRSIAPDRTDETLVLNDFVTDVDNTVSQLVWSFQGGQNITITLLPADNYRVRMVPAPGFTGSEEIIFTVTDPGGLSDTDFVTVTVQQQPPRVRGLPDAVLCSTDSIEHNYVDLDNYVTDIDDDVQSLTWTYSGDSAITTLFDPITRFIRFRLQEREQRGWERRIFTARDPDNNTGSDTIYVVAVRRGWPTLIDIPDVVLVAGGTDNSIVLDEFVFLCDQGSKDQITWSVSGNTRVGATINPTTRRVTLTAPSDFFGTEILTFRAEAPGGGFDEDMIRVDVVPAIGVPFLSPFENILLTNDRPTSLIDQGGHLLIYPDTLRKHIAWTFGGGSADVVVTLNQANETATLTLANTAFLGQLTYSITARNALNGQSDQENLVVNVTEGKGPVLGKLPDVSFLTGEKDTSIKLDLYVRDEDTPDADMVWTVTGNENVTVNTARLAKGADHILELGNIAGFVGNEILVVNVQDPEGNTAKDTMIVSVRFTSEFEISVIPNPVVGEFIDIIVSASDSLKDSPIVKVILPGSEEFLPMNRVPGAFIWKADFAFSERFQGSATILSTALNWFGKALRDSSVFTIGNLQKAAPLVLTGGGATVEFTSGSVSETRKVLLIPEGKSVPADGATGDDVPNLRLVRGYWLGPTQMTLLKPGRMKMVFAPGEFAGFREDKMVLLRGAYDDERPEYVGSASSDGILEGEFNAFGHYYVAVDESPPEIASRGIDLFNENLDVYIDVVDHGSGVGPGGIKAYLGGVELGGMYDETTGRFSVPLVLIRGIESDENSITLIARDRAGNESAQLRIFLEDGLINVPSSYSLRQNFPNPFNPVTNIEYVLPREERVRITIYSLSGQEIFRLVDGVQAAGNHRVQWEGRNSLGIPVSAGVYIYRLETPNYHESRKMTYLK